MYHRGTRFWLALSVASMVACGGQLDETLDHRSPNEGGGGSESQGGTHGIDHPTLLGGTTQQTTLGIGGATTSLTDPECTDAFFSTSNGVVFEGDISEFSDRITPSCALNGSSGTQDFLVTLQNAGGLYVDTLGSDFDTVLGLYAGSCPEVELACDDDGAQGLSRSSRLKIPDDAGPFVTVAVTGFVPNAGHFFLHVGDSSACAPARLPSLLETTITGSTVGSLDRYSSGCSGRLAAGESIYTFIPPATGVYDLAIDESDFDPLIALVHGTCLDQEILCRDDSVGGLNPIIGYYLLAGETYTVIVDGSGGTSGTYTLSIRFNPNDPGSSCNASDTRASARDLDVAACVCEKWPNCCNRAWDSGCVLSRAALNCGTPCPDAS
jgi:hypothetical protein